ncbi:MAG: DUF1211 domain-containing protein [Chitinophagaceae bacterium]|nr:DUF1211 domain-containing protein [Chitinophagaceae bacterium]
MYFKSKFKDFEYNKNRIEAYSDAVIAIVITLLVLELKAPHFKSMDVKECFHQLAESAPELFSWAISFLLVGVYWLQHHNVLHMAKKIDLKIVMINQISLMGICLTPFTSGLFGNNYNNPLSLTLLSLIFLLVSLTLCWLYGYIARNYLKESYDQKSVLKNVRFSYLAGPGFYLLAALCSWFSLIAAYIVLMLIPVLFLFPLDKENKSKMTTEHT